MRNLICTILGETLLYQARSYDNAKMYESARVMKMPSCDMLQEIYGWEVPPPLYNKPYINRQLKTTYFGLLLHHSILRQYSNLSPVQNLLLCTFNLLAFFCPLPFIAFEDAMILQCLCCSSDVLLQLSCLSFCFLSFICQVLWIYFNLVICKWFVPLILCSFVLNYIAHVFLCILEVIAVTNFESICMQNSASTCDESLWVTGILGWKGWLSTASGVHLVNHFYQRLSV